MARLNLFEKFIGSPVKLGWGQPGGVIIMGAQGDGTNLMPGGCFRHKKRQTLWGVCRLVQASGPVSRVLSSGVCQTDGHLSGTSVTRYLVQPTRASKRGGSPLRSYSALLRMGFAVPPPSPGTRWALTPPFHPCPQPRRARPAGGLFSVALSVGLPRLGVTQHPVLWSSDFPHPQEPVEKVQYEATPSTDS